MACRTSSLSSSGYAASTSSIDLPAPSEHLQDNAHGDSNAPDGRLAETNFRSNGDTIQFVHGLASTTMKTIAFREWGEKRYRTGMTGIGSWLSWERRHLACKKFCNPHRVQAGSLRSQGLDALIIEGVRKRS